MPSSVQTVYILKFDTLGANETNVTRNVEMFPQTIAKWLAPHTKKGMHTCAYDQYRINNMTLPFLHTYAVIFDMYLDK